MAASADEDSPPVPAEPSALGRHWRLSPTLSLSASAADPVSDSLDEVFKAFSTPDSPNDALVWASVASPDGRLQLTMEGVRAAHLEPSALVPFLEGSCLGLAMRRMDELVVLHAAALEIDGVGFALLGEKGSGKSTLALLGAARGHRFFGDELLPIDPHRGDAFAFPKSVTLKRGAFRLFEERPEHQDPVRGAVRYLLPSDHAAPHAKLALRALVFPEFSGEVEAGRLIALPAEAVALPLVQQVFGGLERHPASLECVQHLTELPSYHLPFSDGEAALKCLETLAAELRA